MTTLLQKEGQLYRCESEKSGKNYGIVSTIARLSKLGFPRYNTSLATTPRVHPTLALHILRAALGTHVSDHREPRVHQLTPQTRRTLPHFRLLQHLHRSSRYAHKSLLSAPIWTAQSVRTSCVSSMTVFSVGQGNPAALVHATTILTTCNRCDCQRTTQAILTASRNSL